MRPSWRRPLFLAAAVLAVLAFLGAGRFLSSPAQAPRSADIILALGGDNGDRVAVAARLYSQGYAPRVMLTGLENGPAITRPSYLNWRVQFLYDAGVPRQAVVLEAGAGNTWEEAVNTLALLKQQGWKRVIVVSDPPHMRRLHWVWSRVFADTGKEFVLVDSRPDWWDPARWWRNDQSGPFVLMEYVKLVYYMFMH
jgi:uncharacterized SAM-binding protein YcdF (DUF218 family)